MRRHLSNEEIDYLKQQLIAYSITDYNHRNKCFSFNARNASSCVCSKMSSGFQHHGDKLKTIISMTVVFTVTFIIAFCSTCLAIGETSSGSWVSSSFRAFYADTVTDRNIEALNKMGVEHAVPVSSVQDSCSYYYNMLDSNARNVYDALFVGLMDRHTQIDYEDAVDYNTFNLIVTCLLADHPEITWFEGNGQFNEGQGAFYPTYTFDDYETDFNEALLNHSISDIRKRIESIEELEGELDQKSKAHMVTEYIADMASYNFEAEHNQNMISIFKNKESVCAGYAKAVVYLARQFDVPAVYLFGDVYGRTEESENENLGKHAWVAFMIDGAPVYCDPTWYDADWGKDERMFDANSDFLLTHQTQLSTL